MAGTTFSTTLQTLRKNRGVTQEQLATHLGVSPQAVSKWENGSYPDGDLLPQIADYFEVSIDYLYGRAATLNSACAMGESKDYGSITRGKVANFYITKPLPSLAYMPYAHQTPIIKDIILKGKHIM